MRGNQKYLKFEKEFMEKIYSKDRKLNKFLKSNFYIFHQNKQYQVDRKVNLLKYLTDGEKNVAKARLKQLEEDNDVTKFSSVQLLILAGLFVIIKSFFNFNDEKIEAFLGSVMFVIIVSVTLGYAYVVFTFTSGRDYRKTAVYCNSLLEDVLTVEKETVTKDDK